MLMPVTMRCFSKLERASREEILGLQFKKLKYQLDFLYNQNKFYRRKFDAAKVKPEQIRSLDEFRERVPTQDKKDFIADQEQNPPYGDRLGIAHEKLCQINLTSGTSGVGREVYGVSRRDVELAGLTWMNHFHWIGLKKGDIAISVMPLANLAAGLSAFQGMIKMGLVPFQNFGTDSVAKLELMQRFRPHFITLSTAYALRLTLLAKKMGLNPKKDLPQMKGMTIAGETYPISLACELEEFWDCRIHEFYGSTQGGTIFAYTCEHGVVRDSVRGSMHLADPHYFTEVIDPETLKPVQPGEEGEAVVTALTREASPVVRFRTKDKVRYFPYNYCTCGRPFDIWEAGNVSRYDDMMKIKSTNVWPSMIDQVLFSCPEVEEYAGRVWIDEVGNEKVTVRVAFKPTVCFSAAEKQKFLETRARELRAQTGISMDVIDIPRSELPTFEFKSRRWSDEREKNLARNSS